MLHSCEDISDERYGENKKEQIQRRTNRRQPILYSTIQLVIVNLYTKYEVSIVYCFGDIFEEKVHYWSMERKKSEHIQGRTNRWRPVLYPSRQLVIVNLFTKHELSMLCSCGDIFDKNMKRKKKEQIQRRTNRRRPVINSTTQLVIVNLYNKYEVSIIYGFGDIFEEKNTGLNAWRDIKFLSWIVLEMSLTKHYCTECLERKKGEHKQKRTNRRRPVLYPTIQLVMSVCIPNMNFLCYKVVKIDIFDEKYGEKEKRTNTRESRLSILRHNLSLLTCIPNMKFLS